MKIVFLFYSCTYGYEVYFHKSKNLYLSDMHLINNIHFALLNNYSLSQVPVSITFVFIFREIKCLSLVWAQLCLMFLLSFGGQTPVWYTYFTYHMGVQKKKIMIFFVVEEYVCEDVYVFCLPPGLTKTSTLVACLLHN